MAPTTRRMSKKLEWASKGGVFVSSSSPSPPPLMKDVRNYERKFPSRVTRNKAPVYKVEYASENSSSSVGTPIRNKRGRRQILSLARKQIILKHLNRAVGNEFRGMEVLKGNLLAELRKTKRGQGKVTMQDVNRWLKNKAFVSLINSLERSEAQEGQPQPVPSLALEFTDSSNSVQTALKKPLKRIGRNRLRISTSSSSSSGTTLIVPRRRHTRTSTANIAVSNTVPQKLINGNVTNDCRTSSSGISDNHSSSPLCQKRTSSSSNMETEDIMREHLVLERASPIPPHQLDQLSLLSLTQEASGEDYNEGLGDNFASTSEGNQHRKQANPDLYEEEKREMLKFYRDVHGHIYSMKNSYRKLMENRREAHISLEIFCHHLNAMTGFVIFYMNPEEDPTLHQYPAV